MPKDARKWLTENIWWLALIGVVISVRLLAVIPMLLIVMGLATAAVGVMPYWFGWLLWSSNNNWLARYVSDPRTICFHYATVGTCHRTAEGQGSPRLVAAVLVILG